MHQYNSTVLSQVSSAELPLMPVPAFLELLELL